MPTKTDGNKKSDNLFSAGPTASRRHLLQCLLSGCLCLASPASLLKNEEASAMSTPAQERANKGRVTLLESKAIRKETMQGRDSRTPCSLLPARLTWTRCKCAGIHRDIKTSERATYCCPIVSAMLFLVPTSETNMLSACNHNEAHHNLLTIHHPDYQTLDILLECRWLCAYTWLCFSPCSYLQ